MHKHLTRTDLLIRAAHAPCGAFSDCAGMERLGYRNRGQRTTIYYYHP